MSTVTSWRMGIPHNILTARAKFLAAIRHFFTQRGVLEVETPILTEALIADSHLIPFQTTFSATRDEEKILYLNPSPENYMKRLLASGSGDIFQLCKAFRAGENGRYHQPEFTMLEWYRNGYTMYDLMSEVEALLRTVCGWPTVHRATYQASFIQWLGFDPLLVPYPVLEAAALSRGLSPSAIAAEDRTLLLEFLFSSAIEPQLGIEGPQFIYHFPAEQAALAKLNPTDVRVAQRFELYYRGIELANGFDELTDEKEQRLRFEKSVQERAARGAPPVPVDAQFLAALDSGLPACAGVALGVDRLFMLTFKLNRVDDVLAFPLLTA